MPLGAPAVQVAGARGVLRGCHNATNDVQLLNSPRALTSPHNLRFICFLWNVTYNSCQNVYLPNAAFSTQIIDSFDLSARRWKATFSLWLDRGKESSGPDSSTSMTRWGNLAAAHLS